MGFGSRDSGEMAGRAAGRSQRPAFSHQSAGGPFSGGSPRRLLGRRCRGVRPPRVPASPPMIRSSFARRQQYRRLRRAAASGATAIGAGALAIIALGVGAPALAGALALVTIACVLDTRRWLRLAGRSRVGARSEDAVRAALAVLQAEGWQLCHSLPVSRARRYRQRRNRTHRNGLRDRNQNANLSRRPPRQDPRDGDMALPLPSALVPRGRAGGPVRCRREEPGARRRRRPDRVA